MTSPTTPAGATERDWLDKVGLNVKLDYDGRKWHLSEDTKADIRAHEASAVLDGKIEELKRSKMQGYISDPLKHKVDRRIAALTKQKAAMQQEEK